MEIYSKTLINTTLGIMLLAMSQFAIADILDDLQPGHWAEISKNTIENEDPCPTDDCNYSGVSGVAGVVDAWTGGAFASNFGKKGGLIVFGGAHLSYYGNEIYIFSLDTFKWERYTNPSDISKPNKITGHTVDDGICNSFGEYFGENIDMEDRSPCTAHTYDYVDYHPKTNSFVLLGTSSTVLIGGYYSSTTHLFDFTTKQWRRGATRSEGGSMTGASSAYDPNRDVFWLLPGGSAGSKIFAKYDPNANSGAGQWTPYGTYVIDIDAVSAVDPVRDLFVTVDGRGSETVKVMDLSNPTVGPVTITTTGDINIQENGGNGFEWDPDNGMFVAWWSPSHKNPVSPPEARADVYTLKPPPVSENWREATWVWTKVSPAATNTVIPTINNANGTYSRFRYVPSFKGFILINGVSDPVFAYKMPTSSISLTMSVSANMINSGDSVTINWRAQGADSCNASGAWDGIQPIEGTFTSDELTENSSFSLTCAGPEGTSSRTVRVSLISLIPPSLSLSVSPTVVASGGSVTLNWSSSNADACAAEGNWDNVSTTSGSQVVSPIDADSTFTLVCSNTNTQSSVRQTVNVTVAPDEPPVLVTPTVVINATPTELISGGFAKLSWSSTDTGTDTDPCQASGGWTGPKPNVGTDVEVGPIDTDSEFILTCTGAGGIARSSISVIVTSAAPTTPTPTPTTGGEENGNNNGASAGAFSLFVMLILIFSAMFRRHKIYRG